MKTTWIAAVAAVAPALLLTWTAATFAAPSPRAWIGHVVPPWPGQMTQIGDSCIATEIGPCTARMTLLRNARGQRYLAAAWTGPAEQPGEPLWQITDVIRVPPAPDGYILAWGTCSYLGRDPDPRMAAIVRLGENRPGRDVIWARFISPVSLEFEPARPEVVSCPEIDLRARS